jgi:hypothetical protein
MNKKYLEASDSFARPANVTAYGAGDLVANSTTAGSVVPLSFKFPTGYGRMVRVESVYGQIDNTTPTNCDLTLYLYKDSPVSAAGDNAAYSAPLASLQAVINVGQLVAHSDGSCLWNHLGSADSPVVELDGDGILYGLLSVGGAYTPASAETVLAKVKVSVE